MRTPARWSELFLAFFVESAESKNSKSKIRRVDSTIFFLTRGRGRLGFLFIISLSIVLILIRDNGFIKRLA